MKHLQRVLLFKSATLLVLLGGCSTGYTTQNDKIAPDFRLKNLEGQTVTLSEFRGKPVLINFWASWCGPCREEMPYLQQIYNEWKDKGLVFLTIDIGESAETVKEFFRENGLALPVLLDTDKEVGRAYRITGVPETFLIDKDGIIRKKRIGAYPNKQAIENDLNIIMR